MHKVGTRRSPSLIFISFKLRKASSSLKTAQNCVVGICFQHGHFSTGKDDQRLEK